MECGNYYGVVNPSVYNSKCLNELPALYIYYGFLLLSSISCLIAIKKASELTYLVLTQVLYKVDINE